MRVFVTGATGFVGSAVVRELLDHGHEVIGLARSDAAAAKLAEAGAGVHRGALDDFDSLRAGVGAADGVMHLAFDHDFSKYAENAAEDALAIATMGAVLAGSTRPMLVTSGIARLATGRLATEDDRPAPNFPRASEIAAANARLAGARVAAVRLPPSTHGQGDHGFVPILIDIARRTGVSAYVDDGADVWSATHRTDAARVYRLALEQGATSDVYHAIAEEAVPFRTIAEAIGHGLGVPVRSVARAAAAEHFGWFAMFVGSDIAGSSARTRALLDWQPGGPTLLQDLADAGYFAD